MNIYAKLQKARVILQSIDMSKSGLNKFAGFKYFELSDFIPHVNKVMDEMGLCGIVSISEGVATLTIHDSESPDIITFSSPTADASVKGATQIQCLGSLHTYMRRYLWMMAMELVEHDAIDAVKPAVNDAKQDAPNKSDEYAKMLRNATNMQELIATWQVVPKSLHRSLAGVKDEMKAKLQPEQESA